MNRTKDEQIDAIAALYDLGMLLHVVYRQTDYTIGVLHFGEPMGDDKCPDHLIDPPDFMKGGWTRYYEVPMVLHPQKGALLLRKVSHDGPAESRGAIIEDTYSSLTNLEWKIRCRLERLGYWNNRPFTMGAGVITTASCPPDTSPVSVPDEAIIDRDDITRLPARIDQLFDHYATDSARPISDWGQRLIDDLTDSPGFVGDFVGEDSIAESYRECGPDLEGIVDPAA